MTTATPFSRVLVPLELVLAQEDSEHEVRAGGLRVELPPAVRRTLEFGAALARPNGTIRLVHATPTLTTAGLYGGPEGTWMPATTVQELDQQARDSSMAVLRDLAQQFCAEVAAEIESTPTTPTDLILDQARTWKADVIVLATSGRGRARRFFLGSTADKVIRQAPCPVLVVPSDTDAGN